MNEKMTPERAIELLRADINLYQTDVCKPGDGTPDGELMEALMMGIEALGKEIPKFPEMEWDSFDDDAHADFWTSYCPTCGNAVEGGEANCPYCGQKILWEE